MLHRNPFSPWSLLVTFLIKCLRFEYVVTEEFLHLPLFVVERCSIEPQVTGFLCSSRFAQSRSSRLTTLGQDFSSNPSGSFPPPNDPGILVSPRFSFFHCGWLFVGGWEFLRCTTSLWKTGAVSLISLFPLGGNSWGWFWEFS